MPPWPCATTPLTPPPSQTRLEALQVQAADLVAAYNAVKDESTTITLDDRGTELAAAVAAQVAA
jgi:hypothetical protein